MTEEDTPPVNGTSIIDEVELLRRADIIRHNLKTLYSVDLKRDLTSAEMGAYLTQLLQISQTVKRLYYVPTRFEKPIETLCNLAELLSLLSKAREHATASFIKTKEDTLLFSVTLTYRLMTYEERKTLRELRYLGVKEQKSVDDRLEFVIETPLIDPITFTDEVSKVLRLLLWIDEVSTEPDTEGVVKRSINEFLTQLENTSTLEGNVFEHVEFRFVQPVPAERSVWQFDGKTYTVICSAVLFKAPAESQRVLVVFQDQEGHTSAVSANYWNSHFTKVAVKEPMVVNVQIPQRGEDYTSEAGDFVHIYGIVERGDGTKVVLCGGLEGSPQRSIPLHDFLGFKKV